MASVARRSPPLTWAAQSFRGHGRHPKSGSQAGYALPTRPLAVGSWLSLPSNTWLPSSHVATLERETLHPIGAKRQSRTNCWVDPTLCLVIRSDKRRTLRESPWVAACRNRATHSGSPMTGTLFGCGPKASQSILHSAIR